MRGAPSCGPEAPPSPAPPWVQGNTAPAPLTTHRPRQPREERKTACRPRLSRGPPTAGFPLWVPHHVSQDAPYNPRVPGWSRHLPLPLPKARVYLGRARARARCAPAWTRVLGAGLGPGISGLQAGTPRDCGPVLPSIAEGLDDKPSAMLEGTALPGLHRDRHTDKHSYLLLPFLPLHLGGLLPSALRVLLASELLSQMQRAAQSGGWGESTRGRRRRKAPVFVWSHGPEQAASRNALACVH